MFDNILFVLNAVLSTHWKNFESMDKGGGGVGGRKNSFKKISFFFVQ